MLVWLTACLVAPDARDDRLRELRCADASAFLDEDGDGVGGAAGSPCAAGAVAVGGDCDDADPTRWPGAAEDPADGVDQDCDGRDRCWRDGDGDGFGGPEVALGPLGCAGEGVSATDADCDDAAPGVSPGADERACNDVDDDCSAATPDAGEEGIADGVDGDCDGLELCFADADGDGHGTAVLVLSDQLDCRAQNASPVGDDCDDTERAAHPDGVEVPCDGIDGDCDPATPDASAEVALDGVDGDCDGLELCFADLDGDGHGTPGLVTSAALDCRGPDVSLVDDDCDDGEASALPGGVEVPCDGIDGDCDPATPDASAEVPRDGADSDCDGAELCPTDADGDGFGGPPAPSADLTCAASPPGPADDCDDSEPDIHPGAEEGLGGPDLDCDGLAPCLVDGDGDGFGAGHAVLGPPGCAAAGFSAVGGDCDDAAGGVYPVDGVVVPSRDFPTVQGALDAACPGDVVTVSGFVAEDLVVGPGVTLAGGPLSGVVGAIAVNGGTLSHLDVVAALVAPLVTAGDGATLEGVGLALGEPCLDVVGDGVTVRDATFVGCGSPGGPGGGVRAAGVSGLALDAVAFDTVLADVGAALALSAGASATVTSAEFAGCESGSGCVSVVDGARLGLEGAAFLSPAATAGAAAIEVHQAELALSGVTVVAPSGVAAAVWLDRPTGFVVVNQLTIDDAVANNSYGGSAFALDAVADSTAQPLEGGSIRELRVRRASGSGIGAYVWTTQAQPPPVVTVSSSSVEDTVAPWGALVLFGQSGEILGTDLSVARNETEWSAVAGSLQAYADGGATVQIDGVDARGHVQGAGVTTIGPVTLTRVTLFDNVVGLSWVYGPLVVDRFVAARNERALETWYNTTATFDHGALLENVVGVADGSTPYGNVTTIRNTHFGSNGLGIQAAYSGNNTVRTDWCSFDLNGADWDGAFGNYQATGSLASPPGFVAWAPGADDALWDLHLQGDSALVDAGDPAAPDADGTPADIGPEPDPGWRDDLDGDGLPDGWEAAWFGDAGAEPLSDSDRDLVEDGEEYALGTSPLAADTDGDGLFDAADPSPLVP